jgi:predicted O-methyltransferase YrrM
MVINAIKKVTSKIEFFLRNLSTSSFSHKVQPTVGARNSSDISDHLPILQFLVSAFKPHQVLELGTRDGQSTRIFCDYTRKFGAKGYSCDLSPAPSFLAEYSNWTHFQMDDIQLAEQLSVNKTWPNQDKFNGVDFCFIDTSHEYQHTHEELSMFWPLGGKGSIYVFHDTNLSPKTNRRLDGSLNTGWDNQRGVIRAIEEFFKIRVNEDDFFVSDNPHPEINTILHFPWCNGLTLIQKL